MISAKVDPAETQAEAVDFKRFWPILKKAAGRPRATRRTKRRRATYAEVPHAVQS